MAPVHPPNPVPNPPPYPKGQSSPLPPVLARGLLPFSWLAAGLARLRAGLYRRGWMTTTRLDCLVISVGNLTVGGSGKTPMVEFLARSLKEAGWRPGVVSRGYRRQSLADISRARLAPEAGGPEWAESRQAAVQADPVGLGDEPSLLARRNPWLPVYVGRNRALAGKLALIWDRTTALVLDDGYQHLRVARDLNLLLVDAARGLGNGKTLPSGWLREPLSAMGRADAVIFTKVEQGDADFWEDFFIRQGVTAPRFRFGYRAEGLRRLDGGQVLPAKALRGRRVHLVCALAQPEGFAQTIRGLGGEVESLTAMGDHDPYSPATLTRLAAEIQRTAENPTAEKPGTEGPGSQNLGNPGQTTGKPAAQAPLWVTTGKDAVKLAGRLPNPERMWVLDMAVAPPPEWDRFWQEFLARRQPSGGPTAQPSLNNRVAPAGQDR